MVNLVRSGRKQPQPSDVSAGGKARHLRFHHVPGSRLHFANLSPAQPVGAPPAPAPVISAALYDRFSSRGEADFADKVLSAMRYGFGGHVEKDASPTGGA